MKMKVYWATRNKEIVERIRNQFNMPDRMTINRETEIEVSEGDLDVLLKYEEGKLIQIRKL